MLDVAAAIASLEVCGNNSAMTEEGGDQEEADEQGGSQRRKLVGCVVEVMEENRSAGGERKVSSMSVQNVGRSLAGRITWPLTSRQSIGRRSSSSVQSVANSSMTRHCRIVHSEEKPFECPECEKLFAVKGHMKLHIEGVHLKKRYSCNWHGCTWTSSQKPKAHRRNVHTDEVRIVHRYVHHHSQIQLHSTKLLWVDWRKTSK